MLAPFFGCSPFVYFQSGIEMSEISANISSIFRLSVELDRISSTDSRFEYISVNYR